MEMFILGGDMSIIMQIFVTRDAGKINHNRHGVEQTRNAPKEYINMHVSDGSGGVGFFLPCLDVCGSARPNPDRTRQTVINDI